MNTMTSPTVQPRARTRRWIIGIGIGVVLLLTAAYGVMQYRMGSVPANLDLATTQRSSRGVYQVRYTPDGGPVAINQLHRWTIHVATPDGEPVSDAAITVDGGMPQHGHGLPTAPQVTKDLGNGAYLVEGMKFQMGGWWVVDFTIDAHGERDTVRFNLVLQ